MSKQLPYQSPMQLPGLAEQVRQCVDRVYQMARAAFGSAPQTTAKSATDRYLDALHRMVAPELRPRGVAITESVVPRHEMQMLSFWGTPLGRAIVWRAWCPPLSRAQLAECLGVTRQRVHALLRDLDVPARAAITPEIASQLLRYRWATISAEVGRRQP